MNTEASFFAQEFQQICQQVLIQCQGLPDAALQWEMPLQPPLSLLGLALELARSIDTWVLLHIGGRSIFDSDGIDPLSIHTVAQLNACYDMLLQQVQDLLDRLSDTLMNLYIGSRSIENYSIDKHAPMTVRMCLIRAIENSAEHLGQITFIRKLLADGERLFSEQTSYLEQQAI